MTVKIDPYPINTFRPPNFAESSPPVSLPEGSFDRLSRLALRTLQPSIALIFLTEADRQFYNTKEGRSEPRLASPEAPDSRRLCQWVTTSQMPLAVEDSRIELQVKEHASFRDSCGVAFLGVPLMEEKSAIGCFCVMDHEPRHWSEEDIQTLTDIAASIITEIQLRREIHHCEEITRDFVSIGAAAAVANCLLWQSEIFEMGEDALTWNLRILNEETAQRFLTLDVPPGCTYSQMWYPSILPEDMTRIDLFGDQSVREGKSYSQEFRCRRRDGAIRWLREVVEVESIAPGHWKAVGVCIDLTEHKKAEEALSQLASRDELTGLYNRREMYRLLKAETERFRRYGHPFSLILMDVDQFKAINDTYGHYAGDAALRWIGQRMGETIRSIDWPIRHGGDELAIFLPETAEEAALEVAERLRQEIHDHPFIHVVNEEEKSREIEIPFTLSLGIATVPRDAITEDALILAADQALYRAKRKGRNCVVSSSDIEPLPPH